MLLRYKHGLPLYTLINRGIRMKLKIMSRFFLDNWTLSSQVSASFNQRKLLIYLGRECYDMYYYFCHFQPGQLLIYFFSSKKLLSV